ncbi:MAG: hypothetical protein LDL33_03910 [Desulfomonile sp.]|nr:hypothetical protein [Desulfomonile sp.]
MLLDRLWVRIKGEFLVLKDDLRGEGDVRRRAEQFLEKLERCVGEVCRGESPSQDIDVRLAAVSKKLEEVTSDEACEDAPTLQELQDAWEELRRVRSQRPTDPPGGQPPPPNPRRLG